MATKNAKTESGAKFTLSDMAAQIALQEGISKQAAESFLKQFFALVGERIGAGESVKINEIGQFKPVWVEARTSVNVRTGEPYEIPGHYKLGFLPDKSMREAVNAPFACFETVSVTSDELTPSSSVRLSDLSENADSHSGTIESCQEEASVAEPEASVTQGDQISNVSLEDDVLVVASAKIVPATEPEPEIIAGQVREETQGLEKGDSDALLLEPKDEDSCGYTPHRTKIIWIASGIVWGVVVLLLLYAGFAKDTSIKKLFSRSSLLVDDPVEEVIGRISEAESTVVLVPESEEQESENVAMRERESFGVDSISGESSSAELTQEVISEAAPQIAEDNLDLEADSKDKREQQTPIAIEKIEADVFLTTLSLRYYGSKLFWPYIYKENEAKLGNPGVIPIGTLIAIPAAAKYGIDASDPESIAQAKVLAATILARFE